MKALIQSRVGDPVDVLELVDIPETGALGPGEVLVDIKLAPIHFGDFFVIRSLKDEPGEDAAIRRGLEAYGVVAGVGPNVPDTIRVGGRVAIFAAPGTWSERLVAPFPCVIPVPDAIPDETVAQLFVQAMTAIMTFRDIQRTVDAEALRQGAVILTGAGTMVARMIADLMMEEGLHVIGLVRSSDGVSRAKALAPDITFLSTGEAGWQDGVRAATGERPVVAIADCVSGALVGQVAELLQDDGLISTYGGLASEPLGLTGLQITSRGLKINGVTIRTWFTSAGEEVQRADIATAIDLALRRPNLFPVAAALPLEKFREAVELVERPGRNGAVMFKI